MKKVLCVLLVAVLALSCFAACTQQTGGGVEIAVVTDVGQLNDGGFNQGTYEGAKAYAEANGKTYAYYQPANGSNASDADRVEAMNNAIKDGAKVIVTPGFMQENALREVATANPDVKFIFIDGFPIADANGKILANVAGIAYCEQESAYLAGYAAVKEGYRKLGGAFGGGGSNPACNRFAAGYILGADAAAKELGVTIDMQISFLYGSSFSASAELEAQMNGWYQTGTEVIFACGGSMVNSVLAAAQANNGKVIGVDTDQSVLGEEVITSATKGLAESVQWALGQYYAGSFDKIGGTGTSLGAADDAVGLPTATWKLKNFSVNEYNTLFNKIKSGKTKIELPAGLDSDLNALSNVKVTNTNLGNIQK